MAYKIIIFGPPGSGKGVQSQLLSTQLQIPSISSGDCIRDLLKSNNPKFSNWTKIINSGSLLPDLALFEIISNKFDTLNSNGNIIADGFPRTKSQAKLFHESSLLPLEMTYVFILKINKDVLIERIIKRSNIENRSDDNVQAFNNRYTIYLDHQANIQSFYKNVFQINADRPKEIINSEILAICKNST